MGVALGVVKSRQLYSGSGGKVNQLDDPLPMK